MPRLVITGDRPVPRGPAVADVFAGESDEPAAGEGAAATATLPRQRVHRMEIDHGHFAREVDLPADVDQNAISATYRAGLLWVELPKRR